MFALPRTLLFSLTRKDTLKSLIVKRPQVSAGVTRLPGGRVFSRVFPEVVGSPPTCLGKWSWRCLCPLLRIALVVLSTPASIVCLLITVNFTLIHRLNGCWYFFLFYLVFLSRTCRVAVVFITYLNVVVISLSHQCALQKLLFFVIFDFSLLLCVYWLFGISY